MSAPIHIDGPYRTRRIRRLARFAKRMLVLAWGGLCVLAGFAVLGLLTVLFGIKR